MAARDDQDGSGIEKIERGYLGRLLQLTVLGPRVVEAMVDGRQGAGLSLLAAVDNVPVIWAPNGPPSTYRVTGGIGHSGLLSASWLATTVKLLWRVVELAPFDVPEVRKHARHATRLASTTRGENKCSATS